MTMYARVLVSKVCLNGINVFRKNFFSSQIQNRPFKNGYSLLFGKYLVATNIISSGVLMACCDMFRQEIEYRQKKLERRYDLGRLSRMFLVGLALGPIHTYYYKWLAKKWPEKTAKALTSKILLDQVAMSPINIIGFFYGMSYLEGKSQTEMNKELKDKFAIVYLMDWVIWVPTQFINFYYVPVKYQVIYVNVVSMIYDVFLSYIKHRDFTSESLHADTISKKIQIEDIKEE